MDKTLQVRELDEETVAELKARAARHRQSLSAYVARILIDSVATPTPDEIQARLAALRQLGGGATREDILAQVRRQEDQLTQGRGCSSGQTEPVPDQAS
jgi:plasmid stability protein